MEIKKLIETFKNAIIIDIDAKKVYVIKDKKIKIYPDKYYKELLGILELNNFEDDLV